MAYKLVVVHEFHDRPTNRKFHRGDVIYDQDEVARLMVARHKHVVRATVRPGDLPEVATVRHIEMPEVAEDSHF